MITEHWCHGHWSQIWYHDFKYVERKYNFNLQQTKAKKSCKTGWMPRWSSLHPMLSLRLTHNLEQYFDWAGACDPCLWLVELVGCCEVTAVAGAETYIHAVVWYLLFIAWRVLECLCCMQCSESVSLDTTNIRWCHLLNAGSTSLSRVAVFCMIILLLDVLWPACYLDTEIGQQHLVYDIYSHKL